MSKKGSADKRGYKRYKVREGAFAVLRNDSRQLGQIIDISVAGLAFMYLSEEGQFNDSSELDILVAEKGFHSTSLPFKTVTDFEFNNRIPFSSVVMRRRGVKFLGLTNEHVAQLENFIENHTDS